MQTENRFLEDFVKMANGFAGTMAGVGREAETNAREKLKGWLGGLDFVSREEFEAVKAMAAAARDEVDALRARLEAIEGRHIVAPSDGADAPGAPDAPPPVI